jgi:hypothetical protein
MALILKGTVDSAGSPPIQSDIGGSTTGLFYPATNVLALATNATERMRIDASGNVGIGTSAPSTKLEVSGTITGTSFSGAGTGLTGTASININGTVGATTATTGAFTTLSATGVTTVQAGTTALPAITTTGDTNTGISFPSADTIAFSTGGGERVRIDSSGILAVGTNAPTAGYILNVGNPTAVSSLAGASITLFANASLSSSVGGVLNFRSNLGTTSSLLYNMSICGYDHSGDGSADGLSINGYDGVSFCTGANSRNERMRITVAGIVLIGTTSASGTNLFQVNSDSLINGITVGRGAGTSTTNTAVGASALAANTNSERNTAVGYNALAAYIGTSTTTGSTAVGYLALALNTTGTTNTAVGDRALASQTTGSLNTAVGFLALTSSTTGAQNSAFGRQALTTVTSGTQNTAAGLSALAALNTGSLNTAVGRSAGASLQTTTIVATSLVNGTSYQIVTMGTTTAAQWIASGALAGTVGETFTANATPGVGTGTVATSANVAALCQINTFIGYNSGGNVTTGSKNVILGSYTGSAAPISATGSNFIVLSDGDGNVRGMFDSSGNFGIGTTSPSGYLWVPNGGDNAQAQIGQIILNSSIVSGYTGSQLWANWNPLAGTKNTAGWSYGVNLGRNGNFFAVEYIPTGSTSIATRLYINSDGNVGIGTTSATAKLTINNASATDYISFLTAGSVKGVLADDSGNFIIKSASALLFQTNGSERARIDTSGNVGIGTPTPTQKLDVVGSIKSSALTSGRVTYASTGGLLVDSAIMTFNGTTLTLASDTTVPTLSVLGNSATPNLRLGSQGNTSQYWNIGRDNLTTGDFIFANQTSEKMRITSDGTVLIGTSTQNANGGLQLGGSLGMGPNSQIRLSSNADGAGTLKVFATHLVAGGSNSFASGYGEEGRIAALGNTDGLVCLDVGRGQTTFALGAARFRAFNTGTDNSGFSLSKGSAYTIYADTTNVRVGIGTGSPAYTLDIGTSSVTGNIHTYGSITSGTLTGYSIRGVPRLTNDTGTFENTYIGCGATVGNIIFQQGNSFTTASNTERLRIASAGQIGIGGANYGTAGQVLTSGGASAAPTWSTLSTSVVSYDYQTPATGFSYTFTTYSALIMNPANILATGTITMPASPVNGAVVTIATSKGISALTINANTGQTINNPIITLSSGQSASYIYRSASTAWFPFSNGGGLTYTSVSYLVVAGGGGGGGDWSGGGGGGGYLSATPASFTSGSYSIVVGAGGTAGTAGIKGGSGTNSTAFGLTAIGGGGGGSDNDGDDIGRSGGSGGGGAIDGAGGAGTAGQGNNGASGNRGNSLQGGGGGGASQTGQAQAGGNGTAWLNGTYYAGGGGGSRNGSTAAGGLGGGGTGGNGGTGGTVGTNGTGGGGGAQNGGGKIGGDGVVIIRYAGSQQASGGTVTSAGGYTYHTFTTSGTFTA